MLNRESSFRFDSALVYIQASLIWPIENHQRFRAMKKRLLIVADNKQLSEELQQKLGGNSDLLTVTAVSSDAGIELAFQLKPHLILLDSGLLLDAAGS